jgi:hypothetical protein
MMRELFYGVSEQSKAGKHRLDDARALLNAVRWRGADRNERLRKA